MDQLQRYAGLDVRYFENITVHRYNRTKFMMCRKKNFLRVRVEEPHGCPIDCMVYQIEPDVFWTRSLYDEEVPQVFYSPDDAHQMIVSYVQMWKAKQHKKRVQEDMDRIPDEQFYECCPRDALLNGEDTTTLNGGDSCG